MCAMCATMLVLFGGLCGAFTADMLKKYLGVILNGLAGNSLNFSHKTSVSHTVLSNRENHGGRKLSPEVFSLSDNL